jgi:hypothetical protein
MTVSRSSMSSATEASTLARENSLSEVGLDQRHDDQPVDLRGHVFHDGLVERPEWIAPAPGVVSGRSPAPFLTPGRPG